jgi:hypothetical protein
VDPKRRVGYDRGFVLPGESPVTIRYDASDGLCVLRLDAPPMNAIGFAMLDVLRASLRRATEEAEVRGTIITGRPDRWATWAKKPAGAFINTKNGIILQGLATRPGGSSARCGRRRGTSASRRSAGSLTS